jgi:hypothetical protein
MAYGSESDNSDNDNEGEEFDFEDNDNDNDDAGTFMGRMPMSLPPLKNYPQEPPSYWTMCCAFMLGIMYQNLKARRATQIQGQVAQHARRTRSFMIPSMQVFPTIAS